MIIALFGGLLSVVAVAAPAAAATASVTVSNPVLSGTTPIKVGDSLTFTADLSNVNGAVGDTFSITLPAELDFAGALSFPILGDYGQCSWSGKTAICTLTKTATNASGGISLWLKAAATHTGGSSITIGGTTVVPGVPGGSIGTGSTSGPSTSAPAVTKPVKKPGGGVGGWNDYYATSPDWHDIPVLAEWDIHLPVYSTDTKVTISDSLVSGNGYTAHSYWFGALDWNLDHWVVSNGTYNSATAATTDVRWGGTMVGVNAAGGNVTDAVLTVSADKKSFALTFTAKANNTYHLRYFTTTDSTPVAGDLLKNNVTVSGYQTDAIIKVAGASAWLRENYAQFAIKKAVTGATAGNVPVGTNFTVHYTAGSVSKDLTVPYNFTTVTSDWVPAGTKFTITEVNLPTVPGVTWGNYAITGTGVTKNADGSYSVTPAAGATVQLVLTNTAGAPPTPKIDIVKKDAAGNDANTTANSVDLTTTNGATDLVFTITNNGTEDLKTVVVTDSVTAGTATVTGLSCDFSKAAAGAPTTGTTWAGVFKVGASFPCTAKLAGVKAGEQHTDVAKVTGVGVTSNTPVTDDDPYNAKVKGKVSVGDYVWVDTDKDGRQDAGEPGIPGVTLVLTGPDGKSVTDVYGNPVQPTVTDANGLYTFDNLPILKDGEHYTVKIDQTASAEALKPYVPTIANQGDRVGDSSTWTATSEGLTKDGDRDPTLDFGFVLKPPVPAIEIVKKDKAGNDANAVSSSVDLTASKGATDLAFTIKNSGTEDLKSIVVSDSVTAGTATVTDLSCDFSTLGGPSTGVTWDGPFKVADTFTCTAKLAGVVAGAQHTDVAKVTGVGVTSNTPVADDDPYNAKVTPKPEIKIVKTDAANNDANTTSASVDLTGSNGSTGLVFTITNTGNEDLTTVVVTDQVTAGSGTVTGLTCDFSPLGGPATGTTWAGPFTVGSWFTCSATLSGVVAGEQHTDVAKVTGVGVTSKQPVDDDDPYNAKVVKPEITIVKKDAAGNDANATGDAVDLTKSEGKTGLVFTITNSGNEDLSDVTVTDQVTSGSGTISGLSCDFSPLGGPATGTEWAGPFLVGKKFTCTAQLEGVTALGHTDVAKVDAVGTTSRTPVNDDDPYNAKVKGKVSVGDYVWVDTNSDGRQDAGEPGIPGVTLVLTGPDGKPVTDVFGNPVAPTVTDANGLYTFDNLPVLKDGESYKVTIDQDASAKALEPYVPTKAGQGDRVGDSSTWTASSEGLTTDGDRDPTLDFGFVVKPPVPAIEILKKDKAGNEANLVESSVDLTGTDGATDLAFTIRNSGTEDLADVVVSDEVTEGSATVSELSCDFSKLGGPASGTTWDGPFKVGDAFTCTAKLAGVTAGEQHTDVAKVTGVGVTSGAPVADDDPYNAKVTGKVSVGDYVWVDTDKDGRQDAGEPGIPGVTLVVTGPDGKPVTDVFGDPVKPVVTDADGKYSFDNLPVLKDGEHYTVSIDRDASAEALKPYVPTKPGVGDRAGDSSDWSATSEGLTKDGDRDPTLDFGFVAKPDAPAIEIVKTDKSGNDANLVESSVDLTGSKGATDLVFTIKNSGTEDLKSVVVSDSVSAGSASVSGLSCDFSKLGGPASGTTWDGPFKVGDAFTCTAKLAGVTAGEQHTDVAKVTGVGVTSGTAVADDDPYNAKVTGKVSVGDYVWVDTDKDGRQDAGEPGIPGVTLVVTGPDGKPVTDVFGDPVKPVVTDADGKYSFDNLPVLKDGEHYTVTIDRVASIEALKPYVPTVAEQGDRASDSSDWSTASEGLTKDGDRDSTLDFGFVNGPSNPQQPVIDIVKKDAAGKNADTPDSASDLTKSDGTTALVFTITNNGSEDLLDVKVTDQVTAGAGTVSGLSCDFSKLGGPATGTTWAGPFLVGKHFTCTADLTGVTVGDPHTDVAKVDAVGKVSGTPVSDDNPYNAKVTGKVSVGDVVWVDTNGDGRQDAGEPGIPGVTLVVTGPDGKPVTDVFGKPVKPVVTDSDGKYSFDNLPVLKDGEHYTVSIDRDASAEALKPYVPTKPGVGDRAGDSSDWSASSEGLTKDGDRDLTLDFGFVAKPDAPAIEIVKKDAAGNDANNVESSVDLASSAGATGLVFTIRNSGAEDLKSIVVTDSVTAGSATVTGLSCDFSKLGGPASGTTWDGPFKVGDTFTCTAKLAGVVAGEQHTDVAKVTGVGVTSNKPAADDDAYNAKSSRVVDGADDSDDDSAVDSESELAWTGFESGAVALGGVLLLIAGFLLVGGRRRKNTGA